MADNGKVWLWTLILIILVLLAGYLFLDRTMVPYTVSEIYQEQEPYSVVKEYTVQEPYTVQVPSTEMVRTMVSEEVPVMRSYSDVQPYTYMDRTCWLNDYEYEIHYFDGSANDLVYLDDIGFKATTSTDPVERYLAGFNHYSPSTEVGYDKNSHILTVAALVCNKENRKLNGRFLACRYWNGEKDGCPNTVSPAIASNKCEVLYLPWWTQDPVGKTIRLEPFALSQKFVCEGGAAGPETVYLKIDTMYYSPFYSKMFGYYAEQVNYQKPIITTSGTLALPAKYSSGEIKSLGQISKVTSSTRQTLGNYPVTTYRNETKYRNVTKTDVVTEYRTVDKKREVTKYRSMWDDLLLKLGV